MSLLVYVAGASSELDLIERHANHLKVEGVTITHNWCTQVRAETRAEVELSEVERGRYGSADLRGVHRAQVVWLLVPAAASRGCWVELGYALALGRHVVVSGDDGRTIFTALASRRFDSHSAAESYLLDLEFAARDSATNAMAGAFDGVATAARRP